MNVDELRNGVEAALLAAGRPLALDELLALFDERGARVSRRDVRAALGEIGDGWHNRCLELAEVGSGFRLQVRAEYSQWLGGLWAERPPRYSRALLETLALIVYRQPITRGEIEDIRGVSVSTSIVRTLLEREWIRVLGHREVPGRPALYGTTKVFLDAFGLKNLSELPPLTDLKDLDNISADLFADAGISADLPAPEPGEPTSPSRVSPPPSSPPPDPVNAVVSLALECDGDGGDEGVETGTPAEVGPP